MLTKVAIRNVKRFDEVEVEVGNPVLFVGPNDAGKTSALQALMLWDLGLRRWTEKRGGKTAPEKRERARARGPGWSSCFKRKRRA
jgi:predicted ATPase